MVQNINVKVNLVPATSRKTLWDKCNDKEQADIKPPPEKKQRSQRNMNKYQRYPVTKTVTQPEFREKVLKIVRVFNDEMNMDSRKTNLMIVFEVNCYFFRF